MNVRKAQKHMQRAKELLNQSQLGFGAPPELFVRRKTEHRFTEPIKTDKNITNLPDNAIRSVLDNLNCIDSQKFCINSKFYDRLPCQQKKRYCMVSTANCTELNTPHPMTEELKNETPNLYEAVEEWGKRCARRLVGYHEMLFANLDTIKIEEKSKSKEQKLINITVKPRRSKERRLDLYYDTRTKEISNKNHLFKSLSSMKAMQGIIPQDLWNNDLLSGQWDIMFSEQGKLILRKQGKRLDNGIVYTIILSVDEDSMFEYGING